MANVLFVMCDALRVLYFCALECRNMMEEKNYPQGLRRWDKVEVDGFSAGCAVRVFTSWGKYGHLEKHCRTVFSELSLFCFFGILQGWKQNSSYILRSPPCNMMLNNTPQAWIPLVTCRETTAWPASVARSVIQTFFSNDYLSWAQREFSTRSASPLDAKRALVYVNCGNFCLMWTFFHQSQRKSIR